MWMTFEAVERLVELEVLLLRVRGVNSAKGPDSSVGGVPVVHCPDVDHMEEEVQDRVQVEVDREEQGIGEPHGKEQGEEKREQIKRTTWTDHGDNMTHSCRHLRPMWCITHYETRAL